MKNKSLSLLFVFFFLLKAGLFAQNFWVPDANFRNELKQACPTCFTAQDSLITNSSSIQSVNTLYICCSSISSLDGIGYFTSLVSLYCNNNQLTSLPALPATLTRLDCYSNQLQSLPALPNSLGLLHCGSNQLISLPAIPSTLTFLYCNTNQLTSLPALPASLRYLICNNNQLTSLPVLPSSLETLYCFDNQLTSLPFLSAPLSSLWCQNNQLTSLPSIPGSTWDLDCSFNAINCFPTILPHSIFSIPWYNIDIRNTSITCIPNQNTFPLSVVQCSQPLPFCSPANNTCNYNFTSGYVFKDANGNGIKDSLEIGMPVPVNYSSNYGIWPDSAGFFNAVSDTGNITFQVNVPTYLTSTTPASQTVHVVTGSVDTLYFGLQPIPNINDLKVDLTSITFLRPGFKAKYKIHYQNVGTEIITNVKVKFLKPAALANLSSLPAMSAANGDTLIWNIPALYPYQQGDILIQDSVFANATLGDTANAYAWIEPLAADTTPQNNSSASSNIIRGSFDPNDKAVSPEVVLPNTTGYLEYIIRFQNTGTDTAFAVMVIDTLSSLLNVSSLEMISASHSYDLWIENGVAKWNFINILLPDSNTNELESHGFVKFRIKSLPGLNTGASIPNTANIYFDYNVAVITNTIIVNVTPLSLPFIEDEKMQLFPNPVHQTIHFNSNKNKPLGKVDLINSDGKIIETKTISSASFDWQVEQLPVGIYIFKGENWIEKILKK